MMPMQMRNPMSSRPAPMTSVPMLVYMTQFAGCGTATTPSFFLRGASSAPMTQPFAMPMTSQPMVSPLPYDEPTDGHRFFPAETSPCPSPMSRRDR